MDGNSIGSSSSSSAYGYDWRTTSLSDGSYDLSATAYDAAGNSATNTISVTISNSSSGDEPISESGDAVYDDELQSPWIDASYNATVNLTSGSQSKSGSYSVKVDQKSWGALSLRYGNWGSSKSLNTTDYDSLAFYVYGLQSDVDFNVSLSNDNNDNFNEVKTKTISAENWTRISIPLSSLNPNNHEVHRLTLMEISGTQKTYFVDEVTLTGGNSSGSGGSDDGSGGSDDGSGGSTNDPATLTDIFSESLVSPWTDVSWNASVEWQHATNTFEDSRSIKVQQKTWGALSIHYGNWGSSETISTDASSHLTFQVYMESQQGQFNVSLANDQQGSFGKVSSQTLQPDTWTKVSISLDELNPSNDPVQRVTLMETSGEQRNYYIDNLRLE